jgi:UDP-glucose 4-epimerase
VSRVLVTGGAGFIGSNLVDALLERGDEVLVVDDLSTGREENLQDALAAGARLEVESVTAPEGLSRLAREFDPQSLLHLAAQIDVRRAVAEPAFDATVNVVGTIAALEAAREAGVGAFVNASTGGAIYGEGAGRPLPLTEAAECRPEAPYGQSKYAAEGYVSLYARMYALPGASLRLGNVYGPRQDPLGEAGVIAIFSGALAEWRPQTIFGDGRQTRDYVFVGDVVSAVLLAERRLLGGNEAELGAYNVGTGEETSVLELAERLAAIAGPGRPGPQIAPVRAGEVQRIALDSGRAERELGWRPETPLDRGLELTYAALTP